MTRAVPSAAQDLRHFTDLSEVPAAELRAILDHAAALKRDWRKGELSTHRPLAGKTLAMIFDKPSTRTRVSFDLAMRQLGGETLMLTGKEMQRGRGESIADTARVLSRFVDAIVIRILDHSAVEELAQWAEVPIVNGLTKRSHPCQIMADILTFEERRGPTHGPARSRACKADLVRACALTMARRAAKRVSAFSVKLTCLQLADTMAAIESRVARIKARVAQLTGNMEGGTAQR